MRDTDISLSDTDDEETAENVTDGIKDEQEALKQEILNEMCEGYENNDDYNDGSSKDTSDISEEETVDNSDLRSEKEEIKSELEEMFPDEDTEEDPGPQKVKRWGEHYG